MKVWVAVLVAVRVRVGVGGIVTVVVAVKVRVTVDVIVGVAVRDGVLVAVCVDGSVAVWVRVAVAVAVAVAVGGAVAMRAMDIMYEYGPTTVPRSTAIMMDWPLLRSRFIAPELLKGSTAAQPSSAPVHVPSRTEMVGAAGHEPSGKQ